MGLTLITAMEIAYNYPDDILIDAAHDKDTDKWAAFIYRLKEGEIHKLMISTIPYYDSAESAKDEMHTMCKDIKEKYGKQIETTENPQNS